MRYELVNAPSIELLDMKVNDLLRKGWDLYMAPFSDKDGYYQAMVLKLSDKQIFESDTQTEKIRTYLGGI